MEVSEEHRAPRFGLSLPNRGVLFGATSVDELLEVAEAAEASGAFDSVWVGDNLFAKPRLGRSVLLSAIAAHAAVRLGTCCLSTFPLRDPIFLAAQWAALDQVSHGRMILGACIGGSLPREKAEAEFAPFKIALSERGPRLEEGMTILRRLWTEDHVSHQALLPVPRPDPGAQARPEALPADLDRHQPQARAGSASRGGPGPPARGAPGRRLDDRQHARGPLPRALGPDPPGRPGGRTAGTPWSRRSTSWSTSTTTGAAFESVKFLHTYYSPAMTRVHRGLARLRPPAAVIAKIRAYVALHDADLRFASWDQKGQLARALAEVMPAALAPAHPERTRRTHDEPDNGVTRREV
jgi:alkanesulfonate monooxygenase SsuD/methylene tetrahydromethanopterin reductase-like flavin-dependent oxidoreductase (luciferase family)